MTFARSQKGMGLLGWLVLLSVVAFFASVTFKMLPHYLDNMALDKAITSVETDKALGITSVQEFRMHVVKSMQINSIRDLDLDKAMDVKIENNEFRVHLKYEKREPVIQNLDLVARFDKEYRVRMP
jgi:hypothetical protein